MIVRPRGELWEIVCDVCEASWFGLFEDCEWCEKRLARTNEANRRTLLYPDWLNWGDRYRECSDIHRTIWEETRGFTGDYRKRWQRRVFDAIATGLISGNEAAMALQRDQIWMIHMRKSDD